MKIGNAKTIYMTYNRYMFELFERKRIYLDYASATPVLPEALCTMNDAQQFFANPGSIHADGVRAQDILERARASVALELGAKARQVVFTSGLTESNNLAILGYARKLQYLKKSLGETHWIVSAIEHASVIEAFGELERMGGTVTFISPDQSGLISASTLQHALHLNTVFVSIGWGNNEIGIVQHLSQLSRIIHNQNENILFHSDAGQAPLYLSPQVHTLGVDLLSLGSGKLYGPRGVGALYVENPEKLEPIILGGGQEKGLRAGTEDPALATGFAKAFEILSKERKTEAARLLKLRDHLAHEITESVPGVAINGDLKHSLPHMLNISIPDISSEYIVLALDHAGMSISTKSACREGEKNESHVVAALAVGKVDRWRAHNTLRISLGRGTDWRDCEKMAVMLSRVLRQKR